MRIIGYSSIDKNLLTSPGPKAVDISAEVTLSLAGRGCAGRWEDGLYVPCNSTESPFCRSCTVPADPCVICRGDCLKAEKICREGHSVYLAVFTPSIVKVGVSRTYRLETRLREQGADEGYEIARFPDGEAARKLERQLSGRFPDRLGFGDKIAPGGVDREAIAKAVEGFTAARSFRFRHYREDLWMAPIVIKPRKGMALSGGVLGIKGQALVLEKRGALYAVNLDGLIGYDCELRRGKENLQTTLPGL